MVTVNKTNDVPNVDMLIPKTYLYHYVPVDQLDTLMDDKGIKSKELKIFFTRIPNNKKYASFLTKHMLVRINPPKLKKSKSVKYEIIGVNPSNDKEITLTLDIIKKLSAENKYFYKKFEDEELDDVPHGIIKLEYGFLPSFTYKIYLPVMESVQSEILDGIVNVLTESYTTMDIKSDLKTLVNELMTKNKLNPIIVAKYKAAFRSKKIPVLANAKIMNSLIKIANRISKKHARIIAVYSIIIALDDKTNPKSELINIIDKVPSSNDDKIRLFILQKIFDDKKLISRDMFIHLIGYLMGHLE